MKKITFLIIFICFAGIIKGQEKEANISKLLQSQQFIFKVERVFPISGVTKNVFAENYSLVIYNQNVDAHLPYFGEMHRPTYDGEAGIKIEAPHKKYTLTAPENKKYQEIKFDVSNGGEQFSFILQVYNEGKANLIINSSNRQTIRYSGKIKPVKNEK